MAARRHQIRELTKTNNKGFQPPTSIPTIQQTSTGAVPHVHTNNTHTRPKVPHTRHTSHKRSRPHHQDMVSNNTTHKDPHTSHPHHHTYKTAKDRPHEGVNRSQPQFKKRVKRSSDRPSDRVYSTHTHTSYAQTITPLTWDEIKRHTGRTIGWDSQPHPPLCLVTPSASRMRKAHKGTYQK
jgi:hypothetical protein